MKVRSKTIPILTTLVLLAGVTIEAFVRPRPVDAEPWLEVLGESHGGIAGEGGGHHDPRRPGRGQLGRQVLQRGRPHGSLGLHGRHRFGVPVVHHALVATAHQAADHVGAHPAQTDHRELHPPSVGRWMCRFGRPTT